MWWSFACADAGQAEWLRPAFLAYLTARGCADDDYFAAEMVFGELIGNVVRHAPGPIRVDVTWTAGRRPLLAVTDYGPGFRLPEENAVDFMAESGRGLFLVRTFSESVTTERHADGGNSVCATLRIRQAAPFRAPERRASAGNPDPTA